MTAVGDLEVPAFDYTDPALRGPAFHAAMRDAAATSCCEAVAALCKPYPSRVIATVMGTRSGTPSACGSGRTSSSASSE